MDENDIDAVLSRNLSIAAASGEISNDQLNLYLQQLERLDPEAAGRTRKRITLRRTLYETGKQAIGDSLNYGKELFDTFVAQPLSALDIQRTPEQEARRAELSAAQAADPRGAPFSDLDPFIQGAQSGVLGEVLNQVVRQPVQEFLDPEQAVLARIQEAQERADAVNAAETARFNAPEGVSPLAERFAGERQQSEFDRFTQASNQFSNEDPEAVFARQAEEERLRQISGTLQDDPLLRDVPKYDPFAALDQFQVDLARRQGEALANQENLRRFGEGLALQRAPTVADPLTAAITGSTAPQITGNPGNVATNVAAARAVAGNVTVPSAAPLVQTNINQRLRASRLNNDVSNVLSRAQIKQLQQAREKYREDVVYPILTRPR